LKECDCFESQQSMSQISYERHETERSKATKSKQHESVDSA
jgi:hypothetical protein